VASIEEDSLCTIALDHPGAYERERIRAALAGGMSVRKTAAKFDVNPSTVQRVAHLSRAPTTQASPARR